MLKFLRRHTKLLMAVFGSFLMVIFLLPAGASMFQPNPQDQPVGRFTDQGWIGWMLGWGEITLYDRNVARGERQLLGAINPLMAEPAQEEPDVRWILMHHAADRMGLTASEAEIDEVLMATGYSDTSRLGELARNFGMPPDAVRIAVRKWIAIQHYKALVYGMNELHGTDPLTPSRRLQFYQQAMQFLPRIQMMPGLMPMIRMMQISATGQPRLSRPLLERTLSDQQSRVKIAALPIPVAPYLEQIEEVPEDRIQALFQQHRNDLPGEGEPYGFGYKFPDRIRFRALRLDPFDLRRAVDVEEVEALAYYENNPEQFTEQVNPPADQPEAEPTSRKLPYREARDRVYSTLRQEKAAQLGDEIIKAARAKLLSEARQLDRPGGYYKLPEDWQPTTLPDLADQLSEDYGVRVRVVDHTDRWLTRDDAADLRDISRAFLAGVDRRVGFVQYAFSARELYPDGDSPLPSLQLQVGIPSHPLRGPEGSHFLFRLTAANPSRAPESLDEVRGQVRYNARQVMAFEKLRSEQAGWLNQAQANDLSDLADEVNTSVLEPQPFSRREFFGFGGAMQVPNVTGVGQVPGFVDAVFTKADALAAELASENAGNPDLSQLPRSQRLTTVVVPENLTLYVVRIDGFTPMSRQQFEQMVGQPDMPTWVYQSLIGEQLEEDPLAFDALADRLQFELDRPPEEDTDTEG